MMKKTSKQSKRVDFRAFKEQADAEERAKRTGTPMNRRKRIKVTRAFPPHPADSNRSIPP
jgi:hypothetical protein